MTFWNVTRERFECTAISLTTTDKVYFSFISHLVNVLTNSRDTSLCNIHFLEREKNKSYSIYDPLECHTVPQSV